MSTTTIPYMLNKSTITVVLDGAPKQVARTPKSEQILRDALATGDLGVLTRLFDPATGLNAYFDGTGVEIRGSTVTFQGKRITGHLEDRLLDIVASGLDVEMWKLHVERIYSNPSRIARDELALFFESGSLPITSDGCFLAYKRVNDDYTDTYTRTIDNSVGQVVEMPRGEVDADRDRTCSVGLHFCSKDYLRNYLRGRGRIMVVKIDPADVVSIPSDYNNTKGRCWRYEVVGEIDIDDENRDEWGVELPPVYTDTYEGTFDFGDPDEADLSDEWEDREDDDEGDVSEVVSTTAFVAPGPERKSWWKRWLK